MEFLVAELSDNDKNLRLKQLVLGLGYIAVELENGNLGLSANIVHSQAPNCSVFPRAGTIRGKTVREILEQGLKGDLLFRSICLAAINALVNTEGCGDDVDVFNRVSLNNGDKVAMVGLIEPVARMLKEKGCTVAVFENRPVDNPLVMSAEAMTEVCTGADIVIITATSLINNTFNEIVNCSSKARDVIVMGPSTPLLHKAFLSLPVTYLAGSQVTDAEKALEIVMEGGGTQLLFKHGAMKKVVRKVR